jgi:starch synthase
MEGISGTRHEKHEMSEKHRKYKREKMLRILFISPEATPFAKTGGLADVAGALPSALKRLGVDVRLVLPCYRTARDVNLKKRRLRKELRVPLGPEILPASVLESRTESGVMTYLIERDDMYDRSNLYRDGFGDYYDNPERFSFFCHAALKLSETIPFKPDVVHCHDWQTGLVPPLLKETGNRTSPLFGTPSIFTIHNIGYQGIFSEEKFSITGLSRSDFFRPEGLEFWGNFSLLKAGIVYADTVTTVSPRYAREIQTAEFGMGMEGILRQRKSHIHGILNGVDYRHWDPSKDTHLPANYSIRNIQGKRQCKKALIQEMGLDSSLERRPLMGMVSRLDTQKGLDLLVKSLGRILALDVGLVILGSGDRGIEKAIQKAAKRHSNRVGLFIGFDDPLAHRLMAGVDMLLMPSRYEPCGLTQIYALKYGTIPVVRAVGGLDDTIQQFDPNTGEGNGIKFDTYTSRAFLDRLQYAVDLFKNEKTWRGLIRESMKADFSWKYSAREYLKLYESVLK